MGKRARRVALHPARRALAQRIRRIVQLPSARRMPEHQHLLVPDPGPGRHRRLEARLQPLPPPLLAGLFTTSPLRCQLYPPMNGSHPLRTSSRGPARVIVRPATRAPTHKPSTEEHLPCLSGKPFPHVLSASCRIGVDAGEFGFGDILRYKTPLSYSARQRDRVLRTVLRGVRSPRLEVTGDVLDEHDGVPNLVGIEDVRRQRVAAPVPL